jgi:hypothetical protein
MGACGTVEVTTSQRILQFLSSSVKGEQPIPFPMTTRRSRRKDVARRYDLEKVLAQETSSAFHGQQENPNEKDPAGTSPAL